MDNAEKIINFLKEYFGGEKIQIFYTGNWAGDEMFTIYDKDNITIDYSPYYNYIEIFGMNEQDYNRVVNVIGDYSSAIML
jgi:hypothetical protein